jgi:hypothetical protein
MPIIGSFSYGSASAIEYSTVEELLSQLPDNTDNIIVAQDIRDAVYTLWERTGDGLTASVYFQNENPTPVTVGGIPAGSTFPDPTDMQTMWNRLLYPYVAPSCSLGPTYTREYGDPNGLATNSINLNWSVTKNSEDITSITVVGQSVVPTGNSQTGSVTVTGTHSVTPGASQTNTFSMSVTDGTQTDTDNTTITWMNRIYWGSIDLGGVNLTTNPQLVTQVALLCDDDAILDLNDQLSTSKNKSYNGINGNGDHLIFAWPSSVSGATSPTFTVNGLPNTAFTRVRTASAFTNQYGFTTNYEVWVSNTLQNSPIALFSIS